MHGFSVTVSVNCNGNDLKNSINVYLFKREFHLKGLYLKGFTFYSIQVQIVWPNVTLLTSVIVSLKDWYCNKKQLYIFMLFVVYRNSLTEFY